MALRANGTFFWGQVMSNEADVVPKGQVLGLGAYLIVLNLVLLYILVKIWPTKIPFVADQVSHVALLWGILEFDLLPEIHYLLIAAVAGVLGSYIHLATSFADYVGNRQLVRSWVLWYLLRPFIGMALALVVYFVLRGGLIMGDSAAGSLSPYGVAAIAGLAGMFSKQATDKLKEVFENMFRTESPPERRDELRAP
jgi:hypothetical protein